jgi:hypothetical protein
VTSEATERELELEAQLVEARSIIQEQVCGSFQSDHDLVCGMLKFCHIDSSLKFPLT